jgi:uncharacterized glyoxalase superfamily protein PhnB
MTSNVHISLMLAVQDAPAAVGWYKRALGATELWNLGGVPWGIHRQGGFIDPFGHLWLVGDVSPLQQFSG